MTLLEKVLHKILLTESVSPNEVEDAIDNHYRVIVNYHSKGEDKNTGARVVEVYAYGLTKAGNPCFRGWQPYGDTTSKVPSWKLFRLDRVSAWKPTDQKFTHPADFYYKNIGKFNESGDETMSVVYKVAKFGNEDEMPSTPEATPKSKEDVYKTDTEKNMERLRQNVSNPIKLSDIKTNDAFKQFNDAPQVTKSGPKSKEDVKGKEEPEVFKTDTERGMENLRNQLKNPRKIELPNTNKTNVPEKSPEEKEKELKKLRDTLNNKTMSLADLNKKMNEPDVTEPKQEEPEVFKTDTERGMENLRNQLKNPRKIDLNNIPRR